MALRDERIAVIGCGMMGEAMIKGLLRERLVSPEQIVASHPRAERRSELADRHGVGCEADNRVAAEMASVVVLALKPQYLDEVLAEIAGRVSPEALVLTIVAGVRLRHVCSVLGTSHAVRAMPNTPGQIGRGMTVWTATDAVDEAMAYKARMILSALGRDEHVTHEGELDMATALSGTGPAYVFLFMEALIDAGVHLGFSRRLATELVLETMRGAVEYADHAPEHLAKMRNQVTSPGGTTAAALYQLEKGRLRTVLSDAVWAAYRRCTQLGAQADQAAADTSSAAKRS